MDASTASAGALNSSAVNRKPRLQLLHGCVTYFPATLRSFYCLLHVQHGATVVTSVLTTKLSKHLLCFFQWTQRDLRKVQ